jgi:hypothetical protein
MAAALQHSNNNSKSNQGSNQDWQSSQVRQATVANTPFAVSLHTVKGEGVSPFVILHPSVLLSTPAVTTCRYSTAFQHMLMIVQATQHSSDQ